MPITQETILSIYGELSNLVNAIEEISREAQRQVGDSTDTERLAFLWKGVLELEDGSQAVLKRAIKHIMTDSPDLAIDPITGKIG